MKFKNLIDGFDEFAQQWSEGPERITVEEEAALSKIRGQIDQLLEKKPALSLIPDPTAELQQLLVENQHQKTLLEAIFLADPSPIAVLTETELRFAYANPAYRSVLPEPFQNPVGKIYDEVWPVKSQFSSRDRFRQVIETGQPYQMVGIEHIFPNGDICIFKLQARRIFWDKQPACLIIYWDITDQKRAERLDEALNAIDQALLSTFDFDEIMKQVVSMAAGALGSETAAVSLRTGEDWLVHYGHGFSENVVGLKMDDDQERHAVLAIQTKKPVAIPDTFNDHRVNREHLRKWGIRSVLVVPILRRDDAIGIIFFNYLKTPFKFEPAHIEFATQLAASISLGLENSRLFQYLSDEITERKHSEERLAYQSGLLELVHDAIIATDGQMKITFWNQAAEKLYGWNSQEALGQNVSDLLQSGLTGLEREQVLKQSSETGLFQGEVIHHTKTGRRLVIAAQTTVQKNLIGQVTGYITANRDVTEQKQAEENLAFQANLLANISDVVYATDEQLRITAWNHAAEETYGWKEADVLGKPVLELVQSHFPPEERSRLTRELAEKGVVVAEIEHRARGGEQLFFESKTILLRDLDGKVVGYVSVNHDVTGQKRALMAMRDSQQKTQEILESIQDGFMELDTNWCFTYINQQSAQNVGYMPEQLVGKNVWETFPNLLGSSQESFYRQVMDQRQPAQIEISGVLTHKDYEIHAYPSREGITIFWTDITERNRTRETLRVSEEKYHSLFTTMTEGFAVAEIILDDAGKAVDYRFLEVNPAYEKLQGLSRDQLIGTTIRSILPNISSMALEMFAKVVGTGEPVYFENHSHDLDRWYQILSYKTGPGQFAYLSADITERKLAEEMLTASEARYRELADCITDPFTAWDAALRCVYRNKAAEKTTSIPSKQSIGKSFAELYPTLVGSEIHEAYVRVLKTRQPQSLQTEWVRPQDGQKFFHDLRLYPTYEGVAAFSVDITERKQAEKALRESEQLYRAIGESIDFGVWVCAPDGRNIYASPSYLRLVGMTQQECSDFGWGDTLHPDDAERTMAAWKDCVRTGGTWDIEHRFRGVDGKYHPILARGVPVRNEKGEIIYWAGINLDISGLKQAEQELRESEERFRILADSSPTFIWVTDAQGNNQYVNRTYCEYFGVTSKQVEGSNWQPYLHPEDGPAYVSAFLAAVQTRTPFKGETRVRRTDGAWRWMSTYAEPRFSLNGEYLGHIGNSSDINDRITNEEETRARKVQIELQHRLLDHREQERTKIARDLHDGPVQVLTGATFTLHNMLMDQCSPEIAQKLKALRKTLQEQINELRAYAGELRSPTLMKFGLGKAIRSHVDTFQQKYPEIQLIFEEHQDGELLSEEQRLALYRIYQEGLTNILKHARATEVNIRLLKNSDDAVLEIQDNGAGFEVSKDWLELARQGHLGLVGMNERAEAIGGALSIQSQIGSGTKIGVVVPLERSR